ncbi:DUF1735 and LamG domain-containing protein [Mucilaginibacter sp. PAMB04168]|uniref:DUF1735 and LamG domain-containing protein n=1 Tax=Mucilaginibacter sp. PAMB04168 TaxID=3138567 RepID=UPI0031F6583C
MKKLSYKIRLALPVVLGLVSVLFATCKKYVDFKDVIMITGTETNKLIKFTVEGTTATYGVTATATGKVSEDVTVNFEIDSTLIAGYNAETSAKYAIPPKGSYELVGNTGIIKAGTNVSNAVSVKILSTAKFVDGRSYVIPVTIKSVTGTTSVLEASRTVYLKVARVLDFNSIDISNPNFYYPYAFAQPLNNITKYTFEIKCYINDWHPGSNQISRLSNWGPVDESLPNLLRFGEAGSKINQLQWVSAGGSAFSTTEFATKTWYTISCVFDGSTYRMYVNGKLDASFEGAPKTYQLGALEIGMSYAGYQTAQRFLGRVAEIRFWDRPLSLTEIQEGLCGVDAGANGLMGYWKMNEASGNTFFDRSGHGRDMAWPKAVTWITDINNKCAQ